MIFLSKNSSFHYHTPPPPREELTNFNMADNNVVFDELSKIESLGYCLMLAILYVLVFYIWNVPYHRYVLGFPEVYISVSVY